jgi:hypothetical protein
MQNDAETDPQASPFHDPAQAILEQDSGLTDEQRAELWDIFSQSKDPNHLAQQLQAVDALPETKDQLWRAKQATTPMPTQLEKVSEALKEISRMDPATLEMAEKYPTISKAFIDAATKDRGQR